jgi:CheY-like chemotaxis protein
VLVVEDEAPVREATAEVLREAGWRVLTACNGPEALAVLDAGEAVDVLFSDVVMPGGMTGPELARMAQRLRPGIGVLLTSGYTGSALASDCDVFEVLAKPYGRADLLSRLVATKAGACRILEG